jgi:glyoxylase-like metal-dependent hydrolase (beta-lactamase superfamily II)
MEQDRTNLPEVCFGKNVTDVVYNQITIKGDTPDALELKVFFHSYYGFNGTSTLICGKRDAILVSATFLLSDAHRLAAGILETGKNLTHILIPEFHPDHHFGAKVLQDAFPDTKIVAMQSVAKDIVYSADDKITLWGKIFGKNVPDRVYFPMPLTEGRLEVEGHVLEISDGGNADMANETLVWIPSMRAAIPTDLVFWYAYPWTIESDAARRKLIVADLKKLKAMDPKIVIPGHTRIDKFTAEGTTAIDFNLEYFEDYDEILARAKTGDELVNTIEAKYLKKYPGIFNSYGLHWQARIAFPDSCSDRIIPLPGIFYAPGEA